MSIPANRTTHQSTALRTDPSLRMRSGRSCVAAGLLLAAALLPALTHAAPLQPQLTIAVGNGDFSDPANDGEIGGGLAGGSGNAVIGSGPWRGAYAGIASLLAPPTLTIGDGHAEIGNLLGVNIAGILNNHGRFHQDTGAAWVAQRRYRVSVDIDAGEVLGANVLTSGNLGVALASAGSPGSRVCSSLGGTAVLSLLGGTNYRLTLDCQTGDSVSGNVFVHLFGEPTGLVTANLLGSARFDNVSLSTHLLTQVPASLAPGGSGPYTAIVAGQVTPALSVVVLDALGDPIPGVTVTFSAPTSGASATFAPNPAGTDANGVAQVTTTANTIAGTYQVTATVSGIPTPISFTLVNQPGAAAAAGNLSGSGQGAVAGTAFAAPLGLQVFDAFGNGVPNVAVTFAAPASGASASLAPIVVSTNAGGIAATGATANALVGAYAVTASVQGVGQIASFGLVNLLDPSITASGPGEPNQSAGINGEPFACALLVRVSNGNGDPVPGLAVDFVAPASGASATLSDGVSSGSSVGTDTDSDGFALVEATPNGIAGNYTVGAQLRYSLAAPVEFHLRNLAENDPLLINGFDGTCIASVGLLKVDTE